MRTTRTIAMLLSVTVFGCTGDELPTTTGSATRMMPGRANAGTASRPLAGSCETAFDPLPLPPPPVVRQVDTGTCRLAHLGRASFHAIQNIDLATGAQTSVEITFTAANGDVLRASSAGTSVPNGAGVAFTAVMTLSGGTGRFASATGSARIEGSASFVTNTASFTLTDGWLAY